MAKIRGIKPETWEDEKLAEIPLPGRLFYIGMWSFCDDHGVIQDSIKWLKSKILPYDTLRDSDIKSWIDALVKNRMLVPFHYGDKGYYYIRRFRDHQKIDTRWEQSIVPQEVLDELKRQLNQKKSHSEATPRPQCAPGLDIEGEGDIDIEGEGEKEKIPPDGVPLSPEKKSKIKKSSIHLFRESEFFEKTRLAAELMGTRYQDADIDFYHEAALNWSDSKPAKKADWLATVKNWMSRDISEGKFKIKSQNNGHRQNASGYSAGTKKSGGTIDELQALKRGSGDGPPEGTEPGGNKNYSDGKEWQEAEVVNG